MRRVASSLHSPRLALADASIPPSSTSLPDHFRDLTTRSSRCRAQAQAAAPAGGMLHAGRRSSQLSATRSSQFEHVDVRKDHHRLRGVTFVLGHRAIPNQSPAGLPLRSGEVVSHRCERRAQVKQAHLHFFLVLARDYSMSAGRWARWATGVHSPRASRRWVARGRGAADLPRCVLAAPLLK